MELYLIAPHQAKVTKVNVILRQALRLAMQRRLTVQAPGSGCAELRGHKMTTWSDHPTHGRFEPVWREGFGQEAATRAQRLQRRVARHQEHGHARGGFARAAR